MRYLKLFEDFNVLDFTDYHSVVNWVRDNMENDVLFIDEDSTVLSDLGEDRVTEYMYKFRDVTRKNEIEIYRLIMLQNIENLNINNIGEWWSFERDGVGDYGFNGSDRHKHNSFVFTGTINTNDIDWERGFYSFMNYGKDQFECNVKIGSNVIITHINDELLEKEIIGTI